MESSEIQAQIQEGVTYLVVPGPLFEQIPCLELLRTIDERVKLGEKKFKLDLQQCLVISSFGIGNLLRINTLIKENGGSITFTRCNSEIKNILAQLHLDKLLNLEN